MKRLLAVLLLSASAFAHSVTLTWKPVNPLPEHYIVYRATGDEAAEEIAELPATSTAFVDRDVSGGGQYCYTVQWVARGQSGYVGKPICVTIPRDKK